MNVLIYGHEKDSERISETVAKMLLCRGYKANIRVLSDKEKFICEDHVFYNLYFLDSCVKKKM